MPVREALKRLTAEGALTIKANRRIIVPILVPARLAELIELRVDLESFALECGSAASRRQPESPHASSSCDTIAPLGAPTMQDLIGRTLGHYRNVDKIGEGGMGEVYRAHEERLDRDVAIMVLPKSVAGDADRLARFEREAKLLASLSHQNVATLHGLEEHEGQCFLVIELAEGDTWAERIKKGPNGYFHVQ